MKLVVVLALCLLATAVFAQGNSKRMERIRNKQLENRILNAREGGIEDEDELDEMEEVSQDEYRNPCNNHKCKRGEICLLNEMNEALCKCQTCDDEQESVIKVCSTKNVTYESECELDKDHCLCKHGLEGCSSPGQTRVKLDYFAACKVLTKCPDEEMVVFPGRVRDWLFRVMRALADRAELEEDYREWLESARQDKYHADAVVWKFCQLDAQPDRRVTRRELLTIIKTVKPMEHCLVPFLNRCDENDDGAITLNEWGNCLEVKIEHLQHKCKPIKDRLG